MIFNNCFRIDVIDCAWNFPCDVLREQQSIEASRKVSSSQPSCGTLSNQWLLTHRCSACVRWIDRFHFYGCWTNQFLFQRSEEALSKASGVNNTWGLYLSSPRSGLMSTFQWIFLEIEWRNLKLMKDVDKRQKSSLIRCCCCLFALHMHWPIGRREAVRMLETVLSLLSVVFVSSLNLLDAWRKSAKKSVVPSRVSDVMYCSILFCCLWSNRSLLTIYCQDLPSRLLWLLLSSPSSCCIPAVLVQSAFVYEFRQCVRRPSIISIFNASSMPLVKYVLFFSLFRLQQKISTHGILDNSGRPALFSRRIITDAQQRYQSWSNHSRCFP